jgi:hypothetical protein
MAPISQFASKEIIVNLQISLCKHIAQNAKDTADHGPNIYKDMHQTLNVGFS